VGSRLRGDEFTAKCLKISLSSRNSGCARRSYLFHFHSHIPAIRDSSALLLRDLLSDTTVTAEHEKKPKAWVDRNRSVNTV